MTQDISHKCKNCAKYFKDIHNLCYLADIDEVTAETKACADFEEYCGEYIPCAENGDYSPSAPWNAPGMSIRDFI